jgi:hypothetical protein
VPDIGYDLDAMLRAYFADFCVALFGIRFRAVLKGQTLDSPCLEDTRQLIDGASLQYEQA